MVQWVVRSGRAVPLPFLGARVRGSGDSGGAWGHTGGIGVRAGPPGGVVSPHQAPPNQNRPEGVGGSAPRGASRATGARTPLDTLAQPCQIEREKHQKRLRNRARAKHATVALVIPLAELRSPVEKSYRNTYYCAGLLEQHVDGRITEK